MSNLNIRADIGTFFSGNYPNSGEKRWQDPQYTLNENTLHVWCISLDELQQFLPMLRQNLSEDECARAGRYHFKKDKNSFILRRSILRILISNYLEVDARHIQFCYGKRGKPRIANTYSDIPLNFNMSHSKNRLLYAFTCKREVGIDIEHICPIPEAAQIVESYFSNKEKIVFNGLSADLQKEVFFQLWARKEAFLKATGKGFDQSISCFDVLSSDGFVQIQNNHETSGKWHIKDLYPVPGFSAAYAVEGTSPLKCVFRRGSFLHNQNGS
jgi:4'-phosphopantetheinyl transferase